jgi:hypothetical protein
MAIQKSVFKVTSGTLVSDGNSNEGSLNEKGGSEDQDA